MKTFLACMLVGILLGLAAAALTSCKNKPDVCDLQTKVVDGLSTSVATAFACQNPAALKDAITSAVSGFNFCPKAGVKGSVIGLLCAPAINLLVSAGLPADADCSGGVGAAGAIAACQALFP